MWRAGKHNYRNICVCVVQRHTASLNDYLHTLNICSVYLLNVIYFSVFLKLLCTTPCYCTPCVMSSLLSFQISLSILPVVFLLSALLSRSNAVPSIFSPTSLPLSLFYYNLHAISPRTNYTCVPAGFRCKSYLNLSPAVTRTVRGMEENRPPGYRCNLRNEHKFILWDIKALDVGNKLTKRGPCVSLICFDHHQAHLIAQAWILL